MSDASAASFRLRSTRAAPPGHAADGPRRRTYGAALAQFEELIDAARTATPASRPLPLFYALSQAGRAIAAAHAPERWRLRMHGLSCPDLEGETLRIPVHRVPVAGKQDDAIDAFSGVGTATRSELFSEPVALGALWASLPELSDLLPKDQPGLWPRPVLLVPDVPEGKLVPWGRVDVTVVGFDDGDADDLIAHLHAHFPNTIDVVLNRPQGLPHLMSPTDYGHGVKVAWPADSPDVAGHLSAIERVAPGGAGFEPRWLRPAVTGAALSPLMAWWALLFGLSMLARYEPAGWTDALALDSSPLAAPLQQSLHVALERIPELVIGALLVDAG